MQATLKQKGRYCIKGANNSIDKLKENMNHLTTITDFIRHACSQFASANLYYGHGTDNALDDAAALVLGLLNLPYDLHPQYFSATLSEQERQQLLEGIDQRIHKRLPVPYITHRTLYGNVEFYIDQRALIPRSPIAELIENNLEPWWQHNSPQNILDLCCGSGCLGILAKLYNPQSQLTLADIDPQALEVCAINVKRHHLNHDPNLQIIQSDLFSNIKQRYDWIICNPPYVENAEMDTIAAEYHHEPRHALTSGEDGLDFTRALLKQASQYLTDHGLLILEVGMSWSQLEQTYPQIDFDWVEFERGGEGVCIISADELHAWQLAQLL